MTEHVPRIDECARSGHLAIAGAGFYAVFQTSLPEGSSYVLGTQWYTYGRIVATSNAPDTMLLARSEESDHMLPVGKGPFDLELRKHMLIVRHDHTRTLISRLGGMAGRGVGKRLGTAAEELYAATREWNEEVEGAPIELCGVYDATEEAARLVVLDVTGGCSVGLAASEGIACDEDLLVPLAARPRYAHGGDHIINELNSLR